MPFTTTTIKTEDGVCDACFFTPRNGPGPWPAVVWFMDGRGFRPGLMELAERLSSNGYAVLLPNMYYRSGPPGAPLNLPEDRERMMRMHALVNPTSAMRDFPAFLAFLDQQPQVRRGKIATVGYCMGGPLSLSAAAAYPDRVAAAASIHGARLASDAADSPHNRAGAIAGEIYVAVAEIDPWLVDGETDRLRAALAAAGTNHTIELYPGVEHGFAPTDGPLYDRDASERHWERILSLFQRNLGASVAA